jgi:hypothetical protein
MTVILRLELWGAPIRCIGSSDYETLSEKSFIECYMQAVNTTTDQTELGTSEISLCIILFKLLDCRFSVKNPPGKSSATTIV